jgi:hypothetical protein
MLRSGPGGGNSGGGAILRRRHGLHGGGAVQPDPAGRHYPGLYGTAVWVSARYDVRHLPGVIRAEPFRAVPARLRFEQRSYLGGITGLPSDMTSEADCWINSWKPVDLPAQSGCHADHQAGRKFCMFEPGDVMTVEVLEGARPTRQVPVVAGLVDEFIGVAAYMNIHCPECPDAGRPNRFRGLTWR